MTRASKQLMGGGRKGGRSAYGCIVSFENEHGTELTLHRTGAPRAGLRQACADALALDPSFRLTAYSTPQTIYDDMTGGRMDFDGHSGQRQDSLWPEAAALADAGLTHLAHPRLRLGRADKTEERHRRYSA